MHRESAISDRRARSSLLGSTVLALVVAACGGGIDSGASDSSPASSTATGSPATTEEPPTTTATIVTTTTPAPTTTEAPTFTVTTDIAFMTVDGSEFLTNVYQPVGDGPFPVVVSFHGVSDLEKDDPATVAVAKEAAAAGMVVFTPTWITFEQFPITVETMKTWDDIEVCAVAFAQQTAAQYNGDPTTTVVDGFSAGAGGALGFASAPPRTDPVPGCETDALPTPVEGFVLGDGEYWLHSENFDEVFATDPEWVQARLATLIDPSSWTGNPDAKFFLWVAATGTNPRLIGDASDPSGWLAQRDPDGSILADLERLDAAAFGAVTYVDAGKLLALRLSEAGFDVTLDEYPGFHTTEDKVPQIVGYFVTAASG